MVFGLGKSTKGKGSISVTMAFSDRRSADKYDRTVFFRGVNTFGREVTLVIIPSAGRKLWLPAQAGEFRVDKRATATNRQPEWIVKAGLAYEAPLLVMGDFFSPGSQAEATEVTVQVQIDGKVLRRPEFHFTIKRDARFGNERLNAVA